MDNSITLIIAYSTIPIIIFIIIFIITDHIKTSKNKKQQERELEMITNIENAKRIQELQIKQQFLSGFAEIPAIDFLNNKKNYTDVTGVYILHNNTKNIYYVGQSSKVIQRVYNHLSGKGNGDVYADFKYGHNFSVKIIPLTSTNYSSLDDLERDMIKTYNAYSLGYNKNRGNRNNVRR